MNIIENMMEALRSIKGNLLRTILTAAIIAFGITALVGILTTIDGMQSSVDNSFAGLGANSFDIKVERRRGRRSGVNEKVQPPLRYVEAKKFKEIFTNKTVDATVSLYADVTGIAEIKYESSTTNPNTAIIGVDDNYLTIKGYDLQSGRNFNSTDLELNSNAMIIGNEIAMKLFPQENPLNKSLQVLGQRFTVVGVLGKKGSLTGGGDDRVALVTLETGRGLSARRTQTFEITTSVPKVNDMEFIIGEATSTMRIIRGDQLGEEESFNIERSDALAKNFEEVTGYLRIGGFGISFITLLGASIALMNIMMVSVTERTREIGVRKAIGASPSLIRMQFLIEAIVICIMGGVGGILLGITVGNIVSSLISEDANFIIPWGWMLLGLVVCVSVGLLSGFYPAYKASKLDPIESLRYE
ncbi:MAG: putative ABC transport system permease protein [Spirosomataceae bacterium]|jgi:putative ABC transport system permease protein